MKLRNVKFMFFFSNSTFLDQTSYTTGFIFLKTFLVFFGPFSVLCDSSQTKKFVIYNINSFFLLILGKKILFKVYNPLKNKFREISTVKVMFLFTSCRFRIFFLKFRRFYQIIL